MNGVGGAVVIDGQALADVGGVVCCLPGGGGVVVGPPGSGAVVVGLALPVLATDDGVARAGVVSPMLPTDWPDLGDSTTVMTPDGTAVVATARLSVVAVGVVFTGAVAE